jgi:hypothetical protein
MMKAFETSQYCDGRPSGTLRMEAKDQGVVLEHGGGPKGCDIFCIREAIINREGEVFHLFYDGAAEDGWRVCLATSKDLATWEKQGPLLELGKPGEMDSAAAISPWVIRESNEWHMFYIGTPNGKDVPSFPYLTFKARSHFLGGPWIKQKDVIPFGIQPGTYYSLTASAGHVVKHRGEYLMFFSSTTTMPGKECVQRTLGLARTKDLNGKWTVDPHPIVPIEEQIENSSLYYEPENDLWFLFTNHIGVASPLDEYDGKDLITHASIVGNNIGVPPPLLEYTDGVWVYWSRDLNQWDPRNKAVVLDGRNCTWSTKCIGMPSVIAVGKRLAVFYDAPGGTSTSHLQRNIGLAWLDLPLSAPRP